MNTPSLERCKKLKDIGYPQDYWYFCFKDTRKPHKQYNQKDWEFVPFHGDYAWSWIELFSIPLDFWQKWKIPENGYDEHYLIAPTVAEMIDLLPETLWSDHYLRIERNPHLCFKKHNKNFWVSYAIYDDYVEQVPSDSIPNALADMIILLHEQGFKLFDK